MTDELDFDNIFTYHSPSEDQVPDFEAIRSAGWLFSSVIEARTPPSAERSVALARVREAVMWANASIACNPDRMSSPRRD